MADTDLILKIIAQDEAKQALEEARAAVDRMTDAEKKYLEISSKLEQADKAEAEAQKALAESKQTVIKAIEESGSAGEKYAKQLDDLQKQYDDGKITQGQFSEGLKDLKSNIDSAGESGNKWIKSLTDIKSGIDIAQDAISGLKQVWDFAKEGAAIERIGAQFDQVASDFGVNADELVAAMDRAARGTVDDEELMQTATRALTQGVITNANDLTKFVEIARASSVRFGGDTAQALQSILYATEVGAQRSLKATIGVVDFGKAYDDLAMKLGKRKQDLTDEEQLQARVNAVLDKGADLVRKVGDAGEDTATKMQRFELRMANIGDDIKVFAAEGVNTIFTMADAPQKAIDAFTGTAAKMRAEVIAGRMSVDDYNKGLAGMYEATSKLTTGALNGRNALTEETYATYKLTEAQISAIRSGQDLSVAMDAGAGSIRTAGEVSAAAAELMKEKIGEFRAEENRLAQSMQAVQERAQAQAASLKANQEFFADSMSLAVQYTDAEEKRAEIESKLADLDKVIASQGIAHSTVVANQKMTEQDRALALTKLAAAQEDVAQIQRKTNETDAEYSLRLETAKNKVNDLSDALGTHTAVVGGATKAQLEQRNALQGQIDAMDKAAEQQRAVEVFNAVAEAVKKGGLSAEDGAKRLEELNSISHLYSDTALKAAQSQLTLIAAITDPKSEQWSKVLDQNKQALDGLTESEQKAAEKADDMVSQERLAKQEEAARKRRDLSKVEDVKIVEPTGADKSLDRAQKALDYENKNQAALAKTRSEQDKLSEAEEKRGRESKGISDQVVAGYGATDKAIDSTKARTAEMNTAALAATQARSEADERVSHQMKGNIDEIAESYKKIPPVVETVVKQKVITEIVTTDQGAAARDRQVEDREKSAKERAGDTGTAAKKTADDLAALGKSVLETIGALATGQTDKVKTAGGNILDSFKATTTGILGAINDATNTANRGMDSLINSITRAEGVHIVEFKVVVTGDAIPSGGSVKSNVPERQHGGPVYTEGLYYLHPDEYVLSAPMRYGQQAIPQQAIPAAPGRGDTNITTNNFYDGAATKLWIEKQRLDRVQSVLEAM